jgi:ribosomal protein S18 acetylase RimI-like enzyme
MEILKAIKEDLAEILDLQKVCYTENAMRYNDFDIHPLTQTIEEIENDFKEGIFLKAIENSKIVGSIRAFEKDGTCYIGRVIVHPDFQNKGIGQNMMNKLEKLFKNTYRFELFTGHRDDKNLYFYQKLGYKPFKQIKINDNLNMVYLEKMKEIS